MAPPAQPEPQSVDAPSVASSSSSNATSLMPSLSSQASQLSEAGSAATQKSSLSTARTSIPPPHDHPYSATSSSTSRDQTQCQPQSSTSAGFGATIPPPPITSPCFVHSYLDQAVSSSSPTDHMARKSRRAASSSRRSKLNHNDDKANNNNNDRDDNVSHTCEDVKTPHPTSTSSSSGYFNTNHAAGSETNHDQTRPSSSTIRRSSKYSATARTSKQDQSSSFGTSADRAARDASSRSKSWSRGIRGAADSGSEEERGGRSDYNRRKNPNGKLNREKEDGDGIWNGQGQGDEDEDGNSSNASGSETGSGSDTYSRGSSFTLSSGEEEEDEDRVRSLTRQLAETAVGVREMSKQLGRARVKSNIHSVLIITKARDNHLIKLTRELALWLMLTPRNGRDTGLIVYVDSQLRNSKRFDSEGIKRDYPHLFKPIHEGNGSGNGSAHHASSSESSTAKRKRTESGESGSQVSEQEAKKNELSSSITSSRNAAHGGGIGNSNFHSEGQLRYWTSDMCSRTPHLFDFVVTLGGDGTVLFCSWLFQRIVPPVMPFALGSLGFLTNFDFAHYKSVMQSALDDGIRVNLRMRFTATVYRATLPPSSNENDDRVRKRAIKSGRTGEIIMKSIKESGWEGIESPTSASCLDLKNARMSGNDDLSRFPKTEQEKAKDNGNVKAEAEANQNSNPNQNQDHDQDQNPNITGEVLDSQDPNADNKGHFGKKGKGKDKKDKEVMCFYTRPVETFEVLNDLVVDRGPSPYVSLLEVFGDEHHMTTAQADGLCISTPTGSTAYSLSAGGSLVHPEIPAILITPICPHTLSFRPMLLPDSIELRIAVPYNSRSTAWASFDGRGRVELRQGDHIKVTASRYPFPTVCSENQSTDWFKSISRTLKWNERQRQKSFVVVEGEDAEQNDEGDGKGKEKKGKRKTKEGKGNGIQRAASDTNVQNSKADSKAREPSAEEPRADRQDQNGPTSSSASERKKVTIDDDDEEEDDEEYEEDEDEEEPEEEEAETFDIDDSSTSVTRAGSPSSTSKSHHHHHSHSHSQHHRRESSSRSSSSLSLPNGLNTTFAGNIGRSASSSQHPSRRGSQEALSRLMALTPASNQPHNNISELSTNSNGADQARQPPSPPSKNPFGQVSSSISSSDFIRPPPSPASNQSVDSTTNSNDQSMLNSPDRFGLAGPPQPPRAISERHLAHADFRLDAIQSEMNRDTTSEVQQNQAQSQSSSGEKSSRNSSSRDRAGSSDTSNTITESATVRNLDVPRAGFSTSSRSPISASSILRGVHASSSGNSKERDNSVSTGRRGSNASQGRRKGSSNSRTEGAMSTTDTDSTSGAGSAAGGTALVVYGEDSSETESEGEA